MPTSICSMKSASRTASRAALPMASAGVSSADGSRYRARGGIVGVGLGRQQPFGEPRDRFGEEQEHRRDGDVEQQVEVDRDLAFGRATTM